MRFAGWRDDISQLSLFLWHSSGFMRMTSQSRSWFNRDRKSGGVADASGSPLNLEVL
jgi:hypothetical protein